MIPTVGIQSSIKFVFGREDVFVPWSNIDDIVINEVIKLVRNKIIFKFIIFIFRWLHQNVSDYTLIG